ncbi:hypothetical protein BHE74_00007402 [Ensete ventricosum]|nr:hypothetical protein BHE74_00007402 [Ensete ventricosum]
MKYPSLMKGVDIEDGNMEQKHGAFLRQRSRTTKESHGGDLIIQRYDQSDWRVGLLQYLYSLKGARQVKGQGRVALSEFPRVASHLTDTHSGWEFHSVVIGRPEEPLLSNLEENLRSSRVKRDRWWPWYWQFGPVNPSPLGSRGLSSGLFCMGALLIVLLPDYEGLDSYSAELEERVSNSRAMGVEPRGWLTDRATLMLRVLDLTSVGRHRCPLRSG